MENGNTNFGVIQSTIRGAVSCADSVYNFLLYPLLVSAALVFIKVASSFYHNESFWVILPLLIPMTIVGFALLMLNGVVSIKDNVAEVSASLYSIAEFKGLKVEQEEQVTKTKFWGAIRNAVKLISVYQNVSILKNAPMMAIEAIGAIKNVLFLANPLSILLIMGSLVWIWGYTLVLVWSIL